MLDPDPVQSFDLPDDCQADHAVIYPNDTPDEPNFRVVPFLVERVTDDGWTHYREPHDFTVTDAYREAVTERADVPADDLRLKREIPVHGPEPL